MTEISYLTPAVKGFKDRSGMLLVVGILFIIAGAICGCLMAMIPLAAFVPQPPAGAGGPVARPQPRMVDMVAAVFIYGALCAALVTLGIGCVRKRRWVRPLIIVFGWIGLVGGLIGMVAWSFTVPQMGAAMRAAAPPGAPAPPAAFYNMMVGFLTVFFAVIYIVIPAALLWLFRGPDVQATLEHYDPQVRWTDAVPVPVLGLCALLAIGALWGLVTALQGWFFAFGMLTGAAARVVSLAVAAAFAVATWLAFRRRPAGWWMAMALFIVLPVAWVATLLRVDMIELYRAMGMDETQMRVLGKMAAAGSTMMAVSVAAFALGTIAYTWRVRKYFAEPDASPAPVTSEAA